MADVFLSYAREDAGVAERLSHTLEARGWSVWWDRDLIVGRDFDEAIEGELAQAHAAVVLFSPTSVTSRWVRSEATDAADRGILIPVLLGGAALPLPFRTLHAAMISDWDDASTAQAVDWIDQAVASLCRSHVATATASPSSSTAPTTPISPLPSTPTAPAAPATPATTNPPPQRPGAEPPRRAAAASPDSSSPEGSRPEVSRGRRVVVVAVVIAVVAALAGVVAHEVSGGVAAPVQTTSSSAPTTGPTSGGGTQARILQVGSKGADVAALQTMLEAAGYAVGPIDSDFENATLQALRAFESANANRSGVVEDGRIEVNDAEWTLLAGSSKKAPTTVTIPDVSAMTVNDAAANLKDKGLTPAIEEVYSNSVPFGAVISTRPAAEQIVPAGSTVTLVVSLGPQYKVDPSRTIVLPSWLTPPTS